MVELSDAEYEAATRRGEIDLGTKPRAQAVFFDAQKERIVIDLVNGATFAFPARLVQGLETASADQIAHVEILGAGFGLRWDELDIDFSVEGLMAGRFGSPRYMVERFGPGWDVAAAE